jgi:hypothetical protein
MPSEFKKDFSMKHIFLFVLFISVGLLISTVNYITSSILTIASAVVKHSVAIASMQLAFYTQEVHP